MILPMKGKKYFTQVIFSALFLMSTLSSCFSSKPVAYFNGYIDTSLVQDIKIPEQLIQIGDLLSITIYSDNPEATAIYNQAGGATVAPLQAAGVSKSVTSNVASTGGGATGYLVDLDGNIRMHALGNIKAEGMTKDQLNNLITDKLKQLGVLTNPYVIIRFNNFKVTVLGEVRTPGVYTLPSEKANVLEALGLAGDVNDFGIKNNVILVRESQNKRTYARLDLTDPNIFISPNFYIRQNDLLIVFPDAEKPTAKDQRNMQYITLSLAIVSTAAVLITLFR
jgi:polysaccharide biosynthesis/export protein